MSTFLAHIGAIHTYIRLSNWNSSMELLLNLYAQRAAGGLAGTSKKSKQGVDRLCIDARNQNAGVL